MIPVYSSVQVMNEKLARAGQVGTAQGDGSKAGTVLVKFDDAEALEEFKLNDVRVL